MNTLPLIQTNTRAWTRTEPWVGVEHPEYRWTKGADVQATWRKYGWVPPSKIKSEPPCTTSQC